MTLIEILNHVFSLTNKDQSGNTYNIDRFNNDLPVAQIEFVNQQYGLPAQYQLGTPLTKVAYEITQRITDDLKNLKVMCGGESVTDPGPLNVNSAGVAQLPSDYLHLTSLNTTYQDADGSVHYPMVDVLTDAQWSSRINSVIKNRNVKKNPYCNLQAGYIRFRPIDVQYVKMGYIRYPLRPKLDYYMDASDNVVYLPAGTNHLLTAGEVGSAGQTAGTTVVSTTQELELPAYTHPDICAILLGYVSSNLRSEFLKQISEMRKAQGI